MSLPVCPEPRTHELKCHRPFFQDIVMGRKRFEVRKDDRGYAVGDLLILTEWPPEEPGHANCDIETCSDAPDRFPVRVTYILRGGEWGIEPGYVVMGLDNDV